MIGTLTWGEISVLGLLAIQTPAAVVLVWRLVQGLRRRPPLQPIPDRVPQESMPEKATPKGSVSVIIPTLNEGERIQPCLDGLHQQGKAIREIVVVDSRSQDDTVAKVLAMQQQDPRFRVITDDPLPSDWVGRPWALHSGFLAADPATEWVLGIDADTRPQPGLVNALLQEALLCRYDLLTLAPRFVLEHWGEAWLQPALLMTLIYRFGAAGETGHQPSRVMANGQCFLARKSALHALGGYSLAKASFCDDVTLVRAAAERGFRVGFADGSRIFQVRMYTSFAETWQEWGRSLDLKDASLPGQVVVDTLFLGAVQGIPILVLGMLWMGQAWAEQALPWRILLGLNASLVGIRWAMLFPIAESYVARPWTYWLSPLADPLAVVRIALSALSRPRSWRGRSYPG